MTRSRGLPAFVGAVAAAGGFALGVTAVVGPPMAVTPLTLPAVLLVACLVALTESRLLSIRVGDTLWGVTFSEVAVLVGLLVLPSPWVAIGAALGIVVSAVVFRRSLVKTAFNIALYGLGISVVGLITGEPVVADLSLGAVDLARLALGGLAFGAISLLGVSVVIGIATGQHPGAVLRQGAPMSASVSAINTGVTVGVTALGIWSPPTLAVVPPLLGLVFLFYRMSLTAQEERDLWRALEGASAACAQLEEDDVACAVVASALTLVAGAGAAELVIDGGGFGYGPRVWRTQSGAGVSRAIGDGAASVPVVTPLDGHPALVSVSTAHGTTSALVVGLAGPRGTVGRLVLSLAARAKVGDRERQVIATFGRTVAAALERAWLYDQSRTFATVKAFEASHDPLTGLANRTLLRERLGSELATEDGRTTGLLLLDLDHFKSVNDTLGHTVGDALLVEVSERICAAVGDLDVVSRLGGDEFAVLLPGVLDPEAAIEVAHLVLAALSEPVDVDNLRLSVGASIGVACHPHDARDVEELFQRADVAMYQAKCDRNAVRRYAAAADDSSISHLELVAELRAGMDRAEVVLHYQPQVDTLTGRVTGVEALARWQHPRRGLLAPDAFIVAVEHSGLLRAFTNHVLEHAVRDCAGWLQEGIVTTIAVNLSARNLLDRALPSDVAAVLSRHRLPAEMLVLELTETTMVSEQAVVEEVLADLRRLGVQVSVDDFGTGYSSLALLRRVAVNELKVDRSFVARMLDGDNDNDLAIVKATIDLAHSLGLRCVAEGVESEELLVALRGMGCDLVQGWHTGRPEVHALTTRRLRGLPAVPTLPAQRRSDSGLRVILPA